MTPAPTEREARTVTPTDWRDQSDVMDCIAALSAVFERLRFLAGEQPTGRIGLDFILARDALCDVVARAVSLPAPHSVPTDTQECAEDTARRFARELEEIRAAFGNPSALDGLTLAEKAAKCVRMLALMNAPASAQDLSSRQ